MADSSKIFQGQTALQIRLKLYEDLTGQVNRVLIKYRKPNGFEGFWDAVILDAPNGIVAFTVPADSRGLDDSGYWTFWSFVYYKDGTVTPGDSIQAAVYSEGRSYVAFPYGTNSVAGETTMAQEAFEILYNNANSGLAATNVQDALDQEDALIAGFANPPATGVTYNPASSGLPANNVQTAIDSLNNIAALSTLLLGKVNKTLYVDKSRVDAYTQTGSIQQPYKTIAQAASVAVAGNSIFVAAGTYAETAVVPPGVGIYGVGSGFSIISGDLVVGNFAKGLTVLQNLTVSGSACFVQDVTVNGATVVSGELQAYNLNMISSSGPALTLSAGGNLVMIESSIISTSDGSSAIVHSSGNVAINMATITNNSALNPTIISTSGVLNVSHSSVINAGAGLAISVNNGATVGAPNILAEIQETGGVSAGTAYTIQEGVYGSSQTGTNFVKRPASQIAYTPTTGLSTTDVQSTIDFIYSGIRNGAGSPGYTPTRATELYYDTSSNFLYIYNGAWMKVGPFSP